MADWDVIAKQRLTEDWATLRAAYLPLNQAMRRTVEFLDKGGGTFDELLSVVRERVDGALHNLTSLANRRSPWVRLEAIRNLRVLATGLRGAAADDPRALLRYLFALSELLGNVWRDAPTEARVAENLVVEGPLDFWFGCDCCPARRSSSGTWTRSSPGRSTSSRTTWPASATRCRRRRASRRRKTSACRWWTFRPKPCAGATSGSADRAVASTDPLISSISKSAD